MDQSKNRRKSRPQHKVRMSYHIQMIKEEDGKPKRKKKKKKKKQKNNNNQWNGLKLPSGRSNISSDNYSVRSTHASPVFVCGLIHEMWLETENRTVKVFLIFQILCGAIIIVTTGFDLNTTNISVAYQIFGLLIPVVISMVLSCMSGGVLGICHKGKKTVINYAVSGFFSLLACAALLFSIYPQYKTFVKTSSRGKRVAACTCILFSLNFFQMAVTFIDAKNQGTKSNTGEGNCLKILVDEDDMDSKGRRTQKRVFLDIETQASPISTKEPSSRSKGTLTPTPTKRGGRGFKVSNRPALDAVVAASDLASPTRKTKRSQRRSTSHKTLALVVDDAVAANHGAMTLPRPSRKASTNDVNRRSSIRNDWQRATSQEQKISELLQGLHDRRGKAAKQETQNAMVRERNKLSSSMVQGARNLGGQNHLRRSTIAVEAQDSAPKENAPGEQNLPKSQKDQNRMRKNRRLSATMVHASKMHGPQTTKKSHAIAGTPDKELSKLNSPDKKKRRPSKLNSPQILVRAKNGGQSSQRRLNQTKGSCRRELI